MTHSELCRIGGKWLINSKNWKYRCQYVVTEFTSMSSESPDVYGLQGGYLSILLEIKMSRSDFKADLKKRHRQSEGIGTKRYYLCPEDLLKAEELPLGWGLLYCSIKGNVSVIKESEEFEQRDIRNEFSVLYSIIRRSLKRGVLSYNIKEV